MIEKTNYNKYKELKSFYNFEYRGFNMAQVIGTDIMEYVYSDNKVKIRNIIATFLITINFKKLISSEAYTNLIIYSIDRDDYLVLLNAYLEQLNISDETKISGLYPLEVKRKISFKNIFLRLKYNKQISLIENLYFNSLLTLYYNTIDDLLKENIELPKTFYAFNSAFGFETILTLYFKQKKIPTYSFQHGFDYNKKPYGYNTINFDNFVADNMLCWGQYSIDEMVKFGIDKDRLILFGNPKYSSYKRFLRVGDRFKRCLVVLSRDIYEEGNQYLIEIISKLNNIYFDIKLHPNLNSQNYKSLIDSYEHICLLDDNVLVATLMDKKYDFVITYNTSVHYESILNGNLSFGLDVKSDGGILFEKFSSREELNTLIHMYQNKSVQDIDDQMSVFAGYTLGVNDEE